MRLCAVGTARLRMWVLWFVLCAGVLCSADVLDCYCLLQPELSKCGQLFCTLLACLVAGHCGESWWQEDNETDLRNSKLGVTKAEPSRAEL